MNTLLTPNVNPNPPPVLPHDEELARRVHNFLATRNVPALRHLDVEAHGETVVISGRVKTFHEKQLATACCQRVAGVHSVENEVVVEAPPEMKGPHAVRRNVIATHVPPRRPGSHHDRGR